MNILFIYSVYNARSYKRPLYTQEEINFGISYISSSLEAEGHSTALLVYNGIERDFERKVRGKISDFKPGIVCFSPVASEYRFAEKTARYIRSEFPGVFLVCGGVHASLSPGEVISGPFDAVCIGEGEAPMRELASRIGRGARPSGIGNLWIKDGGSVEKNPVRPFIGDLDSLPFPDRRIWQEWIEEDAPAVFSVLAGRGCPFDCTYCCNHALRKIAGGKYVRLRSPGNIVRELEECRKAFPRHETAYLEIESFGIDRQWASDLFAALKRLNASLEKPFSFGTNIRINPGTDFDVLFEAMRECNFKYINIGLESGSERVRRDILKRGYSNNEVLKVFSSAKSNGIKVSFYNLVGVPGETMADFRQTIELNRRCQPDRMINAIFFPYPGTDLYRQCVERGMINGLPAVPYERKFAVLDLAGMTRRQVQRNYIWFIYNVYKGHKPRHVLLARVFRLWLWTKLHGSIFYRQLVNRRPFRWFRIVEW